VEALAGDAGRRPKHLSDNQCERSNPGQLRRERRGSVVPNSDGTKRQFRARDEDRSKPRRGPSRWPRTQMAGWKSSRLCTDGNIYTTPQTSPGSTTWRPWLKIPAGARSISATTNANGRIQISHVGNDGALWYRTQTAPNGTFGPEMRIAANLAGPVSVAKNADGRLEIFAVGTDGNIYSTPQTSAGSTTWRPWLKIPAGAPKHLSDNQCERSNPDQPRRERRGSVVPNSDGAKLVAIRFSIVSGIVHASAFNSDESGTTRPRQVTSPGHHPGQAMVYLDVEDRQEDAIGWNRLKACADPHDASPPLGEPYRDSR
jgi:hypothetical protein